MNVALVSKIMGWAQFVFTQVPVLLTNGIPHSWIGWATLLGSLAMSVGTHAAASTDGSK